MKAVRGTREEFKKRFPQLSSRAVARIVALSTFSLGFTETFLESCLPGSFEEKLIFEDRLKTHFEALSLLETLLQEHQPLGVIAQKEEDESHTFVIGYEDEWLAEQSEQVLLEKSSTPENTSLSLTFGSTRIPVQFKSQNNLFSQEEIQHIFKTLATAVEGPTKTEAINKLMLLSFASASKVDILMKILEDTEQPEGIKIIFKHLSHLGLHKDIPESYAILVKEGSIDARIELVRRFARLKELGQTDKEIIRTLLYTTLQAENYPQVICAIMETLAQPELLDAKEFYRFISLVLTKLLEHLRPENRNGKTPSLILSPLIISTRILFVSLGETDAEHFFQVGIEELEKRSDLFLRTFVAEILSRFATQEAQKKQLAVLVVHDLISDPPEKPVSSNDEFDPQTTLSMAALRRIKSYAIEPLIRFFPKVRASKRRLLLNIFNEIVRSDILSPQEQRALLQFYIDFYRDFDWPQRQIVLESKFFETCTQKELLLEFANKILFRLETVSEESLSAIGFGLQKMGAIALAPVFEQLQRTSRIVLQEKLLFLLGDIFLSPWFQERDSEEVQKILDWLRQFFIEAPSELKGEIGLTLGKLSRCPLLVAEQILEIGYDTLQELHQVHAYDRKKHYKLLEGIAYLGGSTKLPISEVSKIAQLLLKILSQPMPENLVTEERTTEGGARYAFSDATLVYTDVIPRVIFGLGEILLRESVPATLAGSILIRLINRFRDIVSYRVVWAPSNILQIAKVLAQAGKSSRSTLVHKHEILKTLFSRIQNKSILVLLAEIVVANPESEFDEYAKEVLEYTLEQLENPEEEMHLEERILLLNNLVTLLKRDKVEVNSLIVKNLDRLVNTFSDGIRDQVPGIYDQIRKLYTSEEISSGVKIRLQRILETEHF